MWIVAESEEEAKKIAEKAYDSEELGADGNEEIDAVYVVDDEDIGDC